MCLNIFKERKKIQEDLKEILPENRESVLINALAGRNLELAERNLELAEAENDS